MLIPRYAAPLAVLVVSLAALGAGIQRTGIAAAFSDPISHIRAQDESVYANIAIAMALSNDWMTPHFLGRIFLYKPPLQPWLSAFSLKLFGLSLFALRLPMLIAGALGAVLLFCWCARSESPGAGWMAVLLLLSNPLWHIFSRLCYTDTLLAVFNLAALYCLVIDSRLQARRAFFSFAAATAAAVMTKSVAGLLPVLVLLLFFVAAPRAQRPTFARIVQVCLLTGLLIAPWHLYQLAVHPRWFWTDYVKLELFGFGLDPPVRVSKEWSLIFHLKRVCLIDPSLCLLALIAIPALLVAIRRRDSALPVLLASWIVVVCAALSVFQSRNLQYAVFLIAPLCLLAAMYGPLATVRWRRWTIAALFLVAGVKACVPERPWGLALARGVPMPAASILRPYSDRGRPNPLVLVDTDDDFYSATLPLPKVHYCFVDPNGVVVRFGPHYPYLGITVTAEQFNELSRWEPQFRQHLREWGLESGAPIATAIVARTDADVLSIIRSHPSADFYLPARFRDQVESTHEIVVASQDRLLLLARQMPSEPKAVGIMHYKLPRHW